MHSSNHNPALIPSTLVWLGLIVLTFATYGAAQLGLEGEKIVLGVITIALIKGKLVADWYMGLRHVSGFWRPAFTLYLLTVGGLICAAFLLPHGA